MVVIPKAKSDPPPAPNGKGDSDDKFGAVPAVPVREMERLPLRELVYPDAETDPDPLGRELGLRTPLPEAQRSLAAAQGTKPDDHARAMTLAQKLGVSTTLAERMMMHGSREGLARAEQDYDAILRNRPILNKFVANLDHAKLVSDDMKALRDVHDALMFPGPSRSMVNEFWHQTGGGFLKLKAGTHHTLAAMGGDLRANAAAAAAANRRKAEFDAKQPRWARYYAQEVEASSGAGVLRAALGDFRGLINMTLENVGFMAPIMAGAAIGGATGQATLGPVGGVLGTFSGAVGTGTAVEFGMWVDQEIAEAGYDVMDADSLYEAYKDTTLMMRVYSEALNKGLTTSAVDSLSIFVGGKFLRMAKGKGAVAKTGAHAAEFTTQAAGETISEAAGQMAAEGKVDVKEALLEGIVTGPQSGVEVALNLWRQRGFSLKAKEVRERMKAMENMEAFKDVAQAVREAKLEGRSPETMREFLEVLVQNGESRSVFIDREALEEFYRAKGQSARDEIGKLLPGSGRRRLEDSEETGWVEIPAAEMLQALAADPELEALVAKARLTEDSSMTAEEALASLKAEAEAMVSGTLFQKQEAEMREERARLEKEIAEEKAGNPEEEAAQAEAAADEPVSQKDRAVAALDKLTQPAEEEEAAGFTPTSEWQAVPEGAALPPGLEIKMNMETGVNEARLPPTEEAAPTGEATESGEPAEPGQQMTLFQKQKRIEEIDATLAAAQEDREVERKAVAAEYDRLTDELVASAREVKGKMSKRDARMTLAPWFSMLATMQESENLKVSELLKLYPITIQGGTVTFAGGVPQVLQAGGPQAVAAPKDTRALKPTRANVNKVATALGATISDDSDFGFTIDAPEGYEWASEPGTTGLRVDKEGARGGTAAWTAENYADALDRMADGLVATDSEGTPFDGPEVARTPLQTTPDLSTPEARIDFLTRNVGRVQRGDPEEAMSRVQHAIGGGVLAHAVEHIGDLTHRMADTNTLRATGGYEFVLEKVRKMLRSLNHEYGFLREHEENLKSNARYARERGKTDEFIPDASKGLSDEEYAARVDAALAKYVEEHRKIPVFNEVQALGREAAIAIGEKDVDRAVAALEKLQEYLDEGEEAWTRRAQEIDPASVEAFAPETIDVDGTPRPTLNSEGRPIHWSVEGVRNFWRWFGDSKVVDAQGRPVRFYHGTARDFDTLRPGNDVDTSLEELIFVSSSADVAAVRAEASEQSTEMDVGGPGAARVMPVYVKAERVWDWREQGDVEAVLAWRDERGAYESPAERDEDEAVMSAGHWDDIEADPGLLEAIRALGFDGLYMREGVDPLDAGATEETLAVFNGGSFIKSAIGNRGTFSAGADSILLQSSVPRRVQRQRIKPKGRVTVKEAAEEFVRGETPRDYTDKKVFRKAVRDAVAEFDYQMKQERTGQDWYEEDIGTAFALASAKHPELAYDFNARELFTSMLAITSNGQRAKRNWVNADAIYTEWKRTGRIPRVNPANGQVFGSKGQTIAKQLSVLEHLLQTRGREGTVRWLLSKKTRKELRAMRRAAAKNESLRTKMTLPSGKALIDDAMYRITQAMGLSGRQEMELTGAEIFGPKVGPFMLNVNNLMATTVDRWAMRTFGRHFATLTQGTLSDEGTHDAPTDQERVYAKRFFEAVGKARNVDSHVAQAVLWFYEQQLYFESGVAAARSEYFSDGAKSIYQDGPRAGSGAQAPSAAPFAGQRGSGTRGRGAVSVWAPVAGDPQSVGPAQVAGRVGQTALLLADDVASREYFSAQLRALADPGANEWFASVTAKAADELKGAQLFVNAGGTAGVVVMPDGEVAGLWSLEKGAGTALLTSLRSGLAPGSVWLESYATVLPALYTALGFRPVARTAFNPEFKPEGWSYARYKRWQSGKPDIVWQVYDPLHTNREWSTKVRRATPAHPDFDAAEAAAKAEMQAVRGAATVLQAGDTISGAAQFGPPNPGGPRPMHITITPDMNKSTVLHELVGHVGFEMLGDMASAEGASERIRNIYSTILEFAGLKEKGESLEVGRERHLKGLADAARLSQELAAWHQKVAARPGKKAGTPTAHQQAQIERIEAEIAALNEPLERVARGMEKYLEEGEAPSTALRRAFHFFRQWLKGIYKLVGLDIKLNDKVRTAFAMWLATDDEIAAANEEAGFESLPREMLDSLPDNLRDALAQSEMDAHEAATSKAARTIATMEAQAFRVLRSARAAELEREIREEYEQRDYVQALDAMQSDEPGAPKIRTSSVEGENRNALAAIGVLSVRGEGTADELAERLNIATVDELVVLLDEADEKESYIEREVMKRLSAELPTRKQAVKKIREGAASEQRAKALEEQLKALREMVRVEGREADEYSIKYREAVRATKRAEHDLNAHKAALHAASKAARAGDRDVAKLEARRDELRASLDAARTEQRKAEAEAKKASAKANKNLDKRVSEVGARDRKIAKLEGQLEEVREALRGDKTDPARRRATRLAVRVEAQREKLDAARKKQRAAEAALKRARADVEKREETLGTKADRAVLTAQAQKILNSMRIQMIRPHLFLSAARRESVKVMNRVKAGSWALAVQAQERRLLNHELHRLSLKMLARSEVIARYGRRMGTQRVLRALRRAGKRNETTTYVDQMLAVLDDFGFKRHPDAKRARKRKAKLREFLLSEASHGRMLDVPEWLAEETLRPNYRELTLPALEGVYQLMRGIYTLGAKKDSLLTQQRKRGIQQSGDAMAAQVEASHPAEVKVSDDPTLIEKFRDSWKGWAALGTKISYWVRIMDGGQDGGVIQRLLLRPLNDATNRRAVRWRLTTNAYAALEEEYLSEETRKKLDGGWTGRNREDFAGAALSHENRLNFLSLMGSDTGRQRLMAKFTPEQVEAVLESFTEEDVAYVEARWKFWDPLYQEAKAQHERITGQEVKDLPRREFTLTLKSGAVVTLAGGYHPLQYKGVRPRERRKGSDWKEILQSAGSPGVLLDFGFLKERKSEVTDNVSLERNVAERHLMEIVHVIEMREAILDGQALLTHKGFAESVQRHYGVHAYVEMANWLDDLASSNRGPRNGLEKALGWMRMGTVQANLAFRAKTGLMQLFGVRQTIVYLGPRWALAGLRRMFHDASSEGLMKTVRWVQEADPFMAERLRGSFQRELNELREGMPARFRDGYNDLAFWMISRSQYAIDLVTWMGMYEKTMASLPEGTSPEDWHPEAVARASQAVKDTQGGGQVVDMSYWERGPPLVRVFTTFFTETGLKFNMTKLSATRTNWRSGMDVARFIGDMTLLYFFEAAFLAMIGLMMGDDEDDDEEMWAYMWKRPLSAMLDTMPVLRETSGWPMNYPEGAPAGLGLLGAAFDFVREVGQGEIDEGLWKKTNLLGGNVFHYSARAFNEYFDAWEQVMAGEVPTRAVGMRR